MDTVSTGRQSMIGRMRSAFILLLFFLLFLEQAWANEATGEKQMDRVNAMDMNREKLLGKNAPAPLAVTDPELAAIRDRLIFGEIAAKGTLDARQRELITLAALAAVAIAAPLRSHTEAALNAGATPVEIKEALYQTAPYIGFPRVEEAILLANDVFVKLGIKMPLESQGTVTEESRFRDGQAVQKKIFGAENIENMQKNAPAGQQEILTNYLSAYCFGDLYTRRGLDLKMRELLTFSAIVALGGCDPQARAHAAANISVGNSKQNLVDALAVILPYIGFPRTLNGLSAVNAAVPE